MVLGIVSRLHTSTAQAVLSFLLLQTRGGA